MEIDEKELKDYPKPILYESTKKILEQMAKNICKISINGKKGTGFFTEIPINDKLLPVFITCYHLINKEFLEKNNEIKVDLYDDPNEPKSIKIKDKIIYYNEAHDVTIIEIDEKKDGKYDYLELDENILNEKKIDEYIGHSVYILQYPCFYENQQLAVSYGIIKDKYVDKEYNFNHYCSTEKGSSGSPILNISNNKVMGIHKQKTHEKFNYNIGSFLYYSIIKFIDKYNEKNGTKEFERNKRDDNKKYDNNNNKCDNNNEYLKEINKKYNLNIKDINITKLDLRSKKIGNDGLNNLFEKIHFKELKELMLSENNISDINFLEKVKFEKLEKLDLSNNKISNIDILEKVNFKELKELDLYSNKISEIKVFGKIIFGKLEKLNLSENLI